MKNNAYSIKNILLMNLSSIAAFFSLAYISYIEFEKSHAIGYFYLVVGLAMLTGNIKYNYTFYKLKRNQTVNN